MASNSSRGTGAARPRSLLLTGLMGSGKTRVGRRVAGQLGWPFLDTDSLVEARAGLPVREIFERKGEPAFRELEREVLAGLPEERTVVALGGGAIVPAENRALLRGKGLVVWLRSSPKCLARRLQRSAARRPLLADARSFEERVERLRVLLDARREAYASADLQVCTEALSLEAATRRVLEALARMGAP
ncbi:MAG: shikimate kinase [Myxococcota bacterium]